MKREIFVTGIGTDVGKTIASAILCEALLADYWKPIQSGDLENSDGKKIKKLSQKTIVYRESYRLHVPASPHYSAELEEIEIALEKINRPKTQNHLIVEGAGGLLVPINNKHYISDLIKPTDYVVLASRNYLGSINHTLLSVEYLKKIPYKKTGILFVGEENPSSQEIIKTKSGLEIIGRIEQAGEEINNDFIKNQANQIKKSLLKFLDIEN